MFNLSAITREDAIENVKNEAIQKAISAGAKKETIEVLIVNNMPIAYLPNALKVKIKVCGDLS